MPTVLNRLRRATCIAGDHWTTARHRFYIDVRHAYLMMGRRTEDVRFPIEILNAVAPDEAHNLNVVFSTPRLRPLLKIFYQIIIALAENSQLDPWNFPS